MIEWTTRAVGRFLDLLFVDNPTGTAMGALGGVFVVFLGRVFRPLLEQQNIIDLGIHPIFFICAGVFLANYRRARRRGALPAPLEARITFIREELRAGRVDRQEAQVLYKALLEEVVAAVVREKPPKAPGDSALTSG